MKLISEQKRWIQAHLIFDKYPYLPEFNGSIYGFIICEKKFLQRKRIIDTNIRIKKGRFIEDYTVMRDGIYSPEINCYGHIFKNPHLYSSRMLVFSNRETAYSFIHAYYNGRKVGKTSEIDIKYLLNHIELIKVLIPNKAYCVEGYAGGHLSILTKQLRICRDDE